MTSATAGTRHNKSFHDTLLVTLHGAKSISVGMQALATFCQGQLPGLNTHIINFGEIRLRYVLNEPEIRFLIYRSVQLDFMILSEKLLTPSQYPNGKPTRIVVVAQSLGTLVLYEYMRRERIPRFQIDQVILVGSILPPRIDWNDFVDPPSLLGSPPINFVRPFDFVARQAHRIAGERTISGTRGFSPVGTNRAINAFKRGGHTSFNPDDFDDICDIVAGESWTPAYPTEAAFTADYSTTKKALLGLCRTARLC
jgi:hypothetical protein